MEPTTVPVKLPVKSNRIPLDGPKVHHIPSWGALGDEKRLNVIRQIAMQRARDPRITTLAINIIKEAGAVPRDYKAQAAALLKWVQNHKNVYYINEPGERLQDPLYTIKVKYGDCDDMALLLCCFFEAVKLEWKLVLSGRQRGTGLKKRYVEGGTMPPAVNWSHIYCAVGTPPFKATKWYFCEPTVPNVPLGWDVIDGDHSMLPEMGGTGIAKRPANNRVSRQPAGAVAGLAGISALGNGGISASVASAVATEVEDQMHDSPTGTQAAAPFSIWGIEFKKVLPAIVIGVTTSVISQLILDEVRASRQAGRDSKRVLA
jgi:hypothetical protein